MARFKQGFFKPQNPKKYIGDASNIVFRSSWEWQLMREFDANPDIVQWASEEFAVKYFDPTTNKMRRYFPDFIIKKRTKDKKIVTQVIEVKPLDHSFKPQGKMTKNKQKNLIEYTRNFAKWKAIKTFCESNAMEFIVISKNTKNQFVLLTEKDLGL